MSRAVIDQPGIRIVIIGIILSVFLGMAIKTQISDVKIQVHLNKSIEKLQADFHIDYESARINLARWGLPIPGLLITNLRLSPKSVLCQSSQIFIDELEIPISILAILGIRKSIPKVRIKQIELRLSDIDKCIVNTHTIKSELDQYADNIKSKNAREPAADAEQPSSFKNIFINKTKAELKEVYIEKLKVIFDKKIDQPILLRQLNIDLGYEQNRLTEIKLKSKFNAIKDERSELYFLNSDLDGIMRFKSQNLEFIFAINGKLLDGDAKFFIHGNLGQNKISYELGLDRVSARALSPLITHLNYDRKKINYDRLPISISLKNSGKITLGKDAEVESSIRNFLINVDGGTLSSEFVSFEVHRDKIQIKPFSIKIEYIPLTHLKSLENLRKNLDSFDNLGTLSGVFDYKNDNSYSIKGRLTNVMAIFSNRGRRDLQRINQLDIQAIKSGQYFDFMAQNIKINDANVSGNMIAKFNTTNSNYSGKARLSNVVLNEQVWEQFTFVEQTPKVQLVWDFSKNEIENHLLNLEVDNLQLPGLKLSNLVVEIKQNIDNGKKEDKLNVTIKPKNLVADKKMLENEFVNRIFDVTNSISMQSRNAVLKLNGQGWMHMNFEVEMDLISESSKNSNFKFLGSINPKLGLLGKATVSSKNKINRFEVAKRPEDKIQIKDLKF